MVLLLHNIPCRFFSAFIILLAGLDVDVDRDALYRRGR